MGTIESANTTTVREFTRMVKNEHNVDGVDHLFDPSFGHHFRTPLANLYVAPCARRIIRSRLAGHNNNLLPPQPSRQKVVCHGPGPLLREVQRRHL